jgi:hypothetical protein
VEPPYLIYLPTLSTSLSYIHSTTLFFLHAYIHTYGGISGYIHTYLGRRDKRDLMELATYIPTYLDEHDDGLHDCSIYME